MGTNWFQLQDRLFNENNHWFAAANIMAGYEYIPGHISLQAAPYLKLPIRHIGQSRIELYSGGVQLSVKYNSW